MARMLFLRDIDVDVHLRCCSCGHGGALPRALLVRRFGPNYPVLSIAPHYRCSRCDSRDTESRPAPRETLERDGPRVAPAEPSFDASLAALQGLLASVRGPDRQDEGPRRVPPPPWSRRDEEPEDGPANDTGKDDGLAPDFPPMPTFKPFVPPEPRPSVTSWATAGLADEDEDEDEADAGPADTGFADTDWDEPAPEAARPAAPAWTPPPSGPAKSFRPLEDLAADGPADEDVSPLWEPVSLADIVARQEGPAATDEADNWGEGWDEGKEEDAGNPVDDAPLDETLAAMRRFFADADLAGDDEPAPSPVRSAANDARAAGSKPAMNMPAMTEPEEGGEDAEEPANPPVFSYRALVRDDFEEETGEDDQPEEDPEDAEPTDEDILAFAIRDPEKPAPPPARVARATPPANADEDAGFDKTLAALRSMIEDAATEPKILPVRRKAKPSAVPPPSATDMAEEPAPPAMEEEPAAKAPAKPAKPRRSSQEREIEEAMRKLRDLVEDDVPPPPPALPPARTGGRAKPDPIVPDDVRDDPDDAPPAEPVEASTPPGKKRAEANSDSGSPLSKTIAALRGMLELDGRRKR